MAFWHIDPWGEERADVRNALLCAVMVKMWSAKGGDKVKVEDFMPFYEAQRPKQTVREMKNVLMQIPGLKVIRG